MPRHVIDEADTVEISTCGNVHREAMHSPDEFDVLRASSKTVYPPLM